MEIDRINKVAKRNAEPCHGFWDRLRGRGAWMWPLLCFWTFSPLGWLLGLAWNACELIGVGMPAAGWAFGVITGMKGRCVK